MDEKMPCQSLVSSAFFSHSDTCRKPLVLVTSDNNEVEGHPSVTVTTKYLEAIVAFAGALPLVVPPLGGRIDPEEALAYADGVLVTGAPSDVEPHHYGQTPLDKNSHSDPERDALSLPLIRCALEHGLPLLGICRGFQEINVALGGTLHQAVHDVGAFDDHRADKAKSVEQQYALAHTVRAVADSWLEKMVDLREWRVNSVHGQGIDRLAPSLRAQAHAPDGLIEAFTLREEGQFVLGVQWHPEWRTGDNPVSVRLFRAFGAACRDYAAKRCAASTAADER